MKSGEALLLLHAEIVSCCLLYEQQRIEYTELYFFIEALNLLSHIQKEYGVRKQSAEEGSRICKYRRGRKIAGGWRKLDNEEAYDQMSFG
jgi:hypothetical protein